MLWLLLTLQVWKSGCDELESSSGGSALAGGGGAVAAAMGKKDLVFPDPNKAAEVLKNMSAEGETFDQVSYHRNSGVVLRGVFNNSACRALGKRLPTPMTGCFAHHWLEFHVKNSNLAARTLVNSTDLQFVQLHFMDTGFGWQFRSTSKPETEVAHSKQTIDPKQVLALAEDPQPWNAFTHNCQDVSFQQWNALTTGRIDSNAVPSPTVTKVTGAITDSAVLVALIALVCSRKRWFKGNPQDLSEPFLQA